MRFRKIRDPHSIATHVRRTPHGVIGAWYSRTLSQWNAYRLTADMREVRGRSIAAAPTLAELGRRLEALAS